MPDECRNILPNRPACDSDVFFTRRVQLIVQLSELHRAVVKSHPAHTDTDLLSRLFFIDAPSSLEFVSDFLLFVTQLLKGVLTCVCVQALRKSCIGQYVSRDANRQPSA